MRLKTVGSTYFNSWWVAPLIVLVMLLAFAVAGLAYPLVPGLVVEVLFFVFGGTVLSLLVTAIANLARKRWRPGIVHLAMMPLAGVGLFLVVGAMAVAAFFGPSEDHFADELVIPEDIKVADTKAADDSAVAPSGSSDGAEAEDAASGSVAGSFQSDLLAALEQPGSNDPTVTGSVDALAQLHTQAPDVLRRYLAASPAWRVFTEHGNRFATRRWTINGQWRYSLHGYYTNHDLDRWGRSLPRFQSRLTLGFSGEAWYSRRSGDTQVQPGQTRPLTLTTDNQMPESRLVIDVGDDLVVEVFEQSTAHERRLTKAGQRPSGRTRAVSCQPGLGNG